MRILMNEKFLNEMKEKGEITLGKVHPLGIKIIITDNVPDDHVIIDDGEKMTIFYPDGTKGIIESSMTDMFSVVKLWQK